MSTYSVPNTFIPGTKASADEVNENFSYMAEILSNVGIAKYPFCVNSAYRDLNGKEALLQYSGATVTSRVSDTENEILKYTNGACVPLEYAKSESINLIPTSYRALMPIMESDVQDNFTCMATSEEEGHESWHAFDKNIDTYWGSFVGVTEASLIADVSSKYVISAYYIKALAACSWTLYGSNDQVFWDALDSFGVSEPSAVYRKVSPFGNYKSYKLTVKAEGNSYQIRIAEFDVYEKDPIGSLKLPETQNIFIGNSGLEAYPNKIFRQAKAPAPYKFYEALVPQMTSNLVPDGYVISASGYTPNTSPYLATDMNTDTYWLTDDILNEAWFQVQIPNGEVVTACKMTAPLEPTSLERTLMNGKILGSNNGATWFELYSIEDLVWHYPGEIKYFFFPENTTKFSYYRVAGPVPFGAIGEFQIYKEEGNAEHYLGEAKENDIWFKYTEPYSAKKLDADGYWSDYGLVPAGKVDLDAEGQVLKLSVFPYNQNGYNITSLCTKEFSGNVVTHDSYISHFGDIGHIMLPNGFILQWGRAHGTETVIFPAAFPHNALAAITNSLNGNASGGVNALNKTSFIINGSVEDEYYWMAIGW